MSAARSPLVQFVILSMALHALFIVLFGAPSGGSREGRAMWGSLNVFIAEPVAHPGPSLRLDRGIGAEALGITTAKKAMVREAPPVTPRPVAVPVAPAPPLKMSPMKEITPPVVPEPRAAPPIPEPAPPPPEIRAEPLPVQPLFVPIPRIEAPTITPELKPYIPPTVRTQPVEVPVPLLPMPAPPVLPQLALPPRIELPPAEAPAIPAPLVQPVAPAVVETAPTPPVERKPVEAPALPVPPIEHKPVETPAIPTPPIERITPPKIEAAPSVPPVPAVPREQPAVPQPPAIERVEPRVQPREVPLKEPAVSAPSVGPVIRPVDEFGAPLDKTPAAPGAKTDTHIDLEGARSRAREIAREGTGNRAVLPFPMPPLPERKSKEAMIFEKARKPDCKTAYQSLGLLAVVPLVANEFGEGTCRW